MNRMNAFRGTDAASLAFKEELLRLAPGYYLGDLHRHIYMTAKELIGNAGTAYRENLTGEEHTAENVESARHRKPSPLSSWLHTLPEVFVEDDSDTETLRGTDDQFVNDDDKESVHMSEYNKASVIVERDEFYQPYPAALRSPKVTKPFVSVAYIPPHKRGSCENPHSRSQSDSAVLPSNTSLQSRGSQRNYFEDSSQWQRIVNEGRRTFTGSAYRPRPSHYVPASLPSDPARSTTEGTHNRSLSTMSNYKATGQGTNAIRDLADNLNCSVFVSHLPEDVQYKEVFAVITTGSLVTVHINEPIPGRPFSAAKITFKYPEGAARFMALVNSPVGIQICDHHLAAVYNNYGMVEHVEKHQSRVINIHGPYKLMTEGYWRKYFGKVTRYQLDHVAYLPFDPNNKVTRSMEFHFARIEAQAQSILLAIINDAQFRGKVFCKYGTDPCGRDWDTLPSR